MKKVSVLAVAILFLLTGASGVYARNDDSTKSSELRKQFREERKASISALREGFKLQLAAIKNERKQMIVQKFVEKMNRVSQKRVEHWNKILARLTEILSLVSSKLGSSNPAVVIATEKLALAQAAVDAQGAKEYTMNIGSESALKSNAGAAMSGEQSDLRQVLMLVNDARKAVHDALRSLKTASPSTTPTI